ncbi:hypothetical protein QR680_018623 [Steinernema hermaphroditum]|uniref:C-type lectin domain-containing protein n=1 Tax=Steinernema hermaphroditum TaxID=289476 RepID=A0AA39LRB1_9BILA|nr:hypothetical protein QR680_018623 [Steinernema hermaphroditum]
MTLLTAALLLSLVATVLSAPSCPYKPSLAPLSPAQEPTAWQILGDYKYTLIRDPLPFDKAEATCNYIGGHLISIHDQEQAVFINFFLGSPVLFIGGVHISDADKCWTDGSNVDGNFIPDSSDTQPYCVSYVEHGAVSFEFQPRSCEEPAPFVCQVSISNPLTRPPTTLPPPTPAPSTTCPFQPTGKPIQVNEELKWKLYVDAEYAFIKDVASFADAEATCASLGGHLPSEHDYGQFLFVGLQIPPLPYQPREFYTGGIQAGQDSKCWTDGSPFNYAAEIDPLDSTPNCLLQKEIGIVRFKWIGVKCDEPHPFVCARPVGGPTTTAPSTVDPITTPSTPFILQCPFKSDRNPIPTPQPSWKGRFLSFKKYAFIAGPLSFEDAQASCAYLSANLASAHSRSDSSFLAGLIPEGSTSVWIGGLSPGEDKYCWTDDTRWNFDLLNNPVTQLSCVQINNKEVWNQANCGAAAGYICEK